ncbi:MAG: T9SS type A sorting domain-containing protein [Rhizobacter sp.]|nr:T9SS type A sorting domain-containing protein [Ferruginibacter sp.]
MKKIFFTTLLMTAVVLSGLAQAVIADPAVNSMRTTTLNALPLNPLFIPIDSVVELKVPVINYNLVNALPSGTCKIKIGLGSRLVLNPAFDLTTVNTSSYFQWTAETSGGQVQITGELIATLPSNYSDTATFQLKGILLGNSTITTNFLVTNHNTTVNLSDENGTNNNASLAYTVVEGAGGPLPVTFTDVTVKKEQCRLDIVAYTESEINVKLYELEVSTDGINYTAKQSQLAANQSRYRFQLLMDEEMKNAGNLFFRVKSVDIDGSYGYSMTRRINGGCADATVRSKISVFPNPVTKQQGEIFIRSGSENFNGKYSLYLYDMNGKIISRDELVLSNVNQFPYQVTHLSSGQYIIRLVTEKGTAYDPLPLQVL